MSQASDFGFDVQEKMQNGMGLRQATRESIVSYPGATWDNDDNEIHFPDKSVAVLEDDGSGFIIKD